MDVIIQLLIIIMINPVISICIIISMIITAYK